MKKHLHIHQLFALGCLGFTSLLIFQPLQAGWKPAGTDIKQIYPFIFLTAPEDIPISYVGTGFIPEINIKVSDQQTPSSTTEWQMLGITKYIIGGIESYSPNANVPYLREVGTKKIKASAHYEAIKKPVDPSGTGSIPAYPVAETEDTRSLTTNIVK